MLGHAAADDSFRFNHIAKAETKKGRSEDQPFSLFVSVLVLVTRTRSVHNFNTTVLRFANAVCGFNARTRFTEGFTRDSAAANAARFKIRTNSGVPTLGQTDVVAGRTRFVSVTSQHNLSRTTITICGNRIVENRSRFWCDVRLIPVKEHNIRARCTYCRWWRWWWWWRWRWWWWRRWWRWCRWFAAEVVDQATQNRVG